MGFAIAMLLGWPTLGAYGGGAAPATGSFILLESGDRLLLEDGSKLVLE